MNSITFDIENEKRFSTRIQKFFRRYQISDILKKSNAYKTQGFSVVTLVEYLFCLVFRNRSMFLDMQSKKAPGFRKDTIYRLKNATHINWLRFTTLLSSKIITETIEPLTDEKRRNAFIVDDSLFERKGSAKVELLAKVFDHASHRYTRGFRMLTLGWSDGVTFMPVNSCLLSSVQEEKRNASKCVDANSNGAKARKMAVKKATEVVSYLISEAMDAGIHADYVLFDSWFSSPKVIRSMKDIELDIGLDVVAMVKKSSKVHYRFQGELCSCKDIFRRCKHRPGKSRYLLSVPVEICGKDEDIAPVPAKLVFVRNRSNRKDYLVLLSTDTNLTEDEIIQLYGKRWDIEVFFKTCKSVLKLTKECRSLTYDAMCAQTAIVFMRYMFLAVGVREDSDLRSAGPLFCLVADELADISFADAFEKLQLFLQKLLEGFAAQNEQLCGLAMEFFASLPNDVKQLLDFSGFESTFAPKTGCEV